MRNIFFALLFVLTAPADPPCTLHIKVENLQKRTGKMWVALCNDPKDFIGKSFKNQVVAVPSSGEMIITFEDIPKGNYAVRLFQDVNNSGKLETGMFGIPKEPYGFSNNPTLMSQPKFKDGEFQIFGNQTIIIRLK